MRLICVYSKYSTAYCCTTVIVQQRSRVSNLELFLMRVELNSFELGRKRVIQFMLCFYSYADGYKVTPCVFGYACGYRVMPCLFELCIVHFQLCLLPGALNAQPTGLFLVHSCYYLTVRHFTVVTDHASLTWLRNCKEPEGVVVRWISLRQPFDFKIVHKPGEHHKTC